MIHNRVEEHVQDAYKALQARFPDFCGCDVCRADVLVYALNRLPARYIASEEGRVLTELDLDSQQNRVNIEVTVLDAFRRVMAQPRCPTRRARAPS
jgi:competence protein ComFB